MLGTLKNVGSLITRKPPPVGQTPHEVVHRENKWRLLRFRGDVRYRVPILIVPSMINRWYVLDLMPGRSLVEWLVQQGHDVYVIDWGTPGAEDRFLTFDDVVGRYLGRALRRSTESSGSPRVHVLGYCMGGTLAAIHASVYPERIASLTALASPVAFHDDSLLAAWTRNPAFDVEGFVDAFGNAPWPMLQASFMMLRPTLTLSKLAFLLDKAVTGRGFDDAFLDGFFAKEKWANDNVALAGGVFRTWVRDIYRRDAIMEGSLTLDGHPVRLEAVRSALHVISFEDDYIVPKATAAPLAERASSEDILHTHLRGGHIGAVVSKGASERLWPVMQQWWAERDGRPQAVRAVSSGV